MGQTHSCCSVRNDVKLFDKSPIASDMKLICNERQRWPYRDDDRTRPAIALGPYVKSKVWLQCLSAIPMVLLDDEAYWFTDIASTQMPLKNGWNDESTRETVPDASGKWRQLYMPRFGLASEGSWYDCIEMTMSETKTDLSQWNARPHYNKDCYNSTTDFRLQLLAPLMSIAEFRKEREATMTWPTPSVGACRVMDVRS